MSTPFPVPRPPAVPRPPLPANAPPVRMTEPGDGTTGHPAVDAMLASLANAASLSPADQIAEYEAAHQILRETLATIDQA
ncbi:hypothetical protein [Catenuloplanes indicus]|uniref:Uncharacterized protein n=1 Tax=Catenuloplanes indicus TaxID=137267 RepID=A0AAE3W840_9ACTN|nr:hypothetical protein [Catenuloplanes indicus]MDQ0370237.1 hypothetical protein [Catenuloplanes indicus]